MENNVIYWRCRSCGDKIISLRSESHIIDTCSCFNSSVDAEEFYTRFIGNVEEITKEDYEKE